MVVPGTTSSIKWWGWQRLGHKLVRMGWQSIQTVGESAYVIFILLQKIQNMAFGYHPMGAPHAYANR